MEKIAPQQVRGLSLSDLNHLLEDLLNGRTYTPSESHALKQALILISYKNLLDKSTNELWSNQINKSMIVEKIERAIDEIWINLGKPDVASPAPPQPDR